jgi:hypothetical protein
LTKEELISSIFLLSGGLKIRGTYLAPVDLLESLHNLQDPAADIIL